MGVKILAVEDEDNWRKIFRNSFRKPDYELQMTDDVDEAENLIRQKDKIDTITRNWRSYFISNSQSGQLHKWDCSLHPFSK